MNYSEHIFNNIIQVRQIISDIFQDDPDNDIFDILLEIQGELIDNYCSLKLTIGNKWTYTDLGEAVDQYFNKCVEGKADFNIELLDEILYHNIKNPLVQEENKNKKGDLL